MTTGISALDHSMQATHVWLNDFADFLGCDRSQKEKVFSGIRAALKSLRDRMPPPEALNFADQLPTVLKGVFFDGWLPHRTPINVHDFSNLIKYHMAGASQFDPRRLMEALFYAINRNLSSGEIADIRSQLPQDLKSLLHQ